MCISNHIAGTPRIYICNNDETIKVYSLPDLQRITTINLPTAVNYASISPDGTKLIAVGDSPQVFLYEIGRNGSYQRTATLAGSADAAFSCAWNQSSNKFAVASQDGYVCVWDVRSSEKLVKLGSKQNPQVKGACRSVKFSPSGSIDLLMYSEVCRFYYPCLLISTFPISMWWTRALLMSGKLYAWHHPILICILQG